MLKEPCSWHLCPYKAIDALLGVDLIFEGKHYTKKRVPLCQDHLSQFGRSGHLTLKPEMLFTPDR